MNSSEIFVRQFVILFQTMTARQYARSITMNTMTATATDGRMKTTKTKPSTYLWRCKSGAKTGYLKSANRYKHRVCLRGHRRHAEAFTGAQQYDCAPYIRRAYKAVRKTVVK